MPHFIVFVVIRQICFRDYAEDIAVSDDCRAVKKLAAVSERNADGYHRIFSFGRFFYARKSLLGGVQQLFREKQISAGVGCYRKLRKKKYICLYFVRFSISFIISRQFAPTSATVVSGDAAAILRNPSFIVKPLIFLNICCEALCLYCFYTAALSFDILRLALDSYDLAICFMPYFLCFTLYTLCIEPFVCYLFAVRLARLRCDKRTAVKPLSRKVRQ